MKGIERHRFVMLLVLAIIVLAPELYLVRASPDANVTTTAVAPAKTVTAIKPALLPTIKPALLPTIKPAPAPPPTPDDFVQLARDVTAALRAGNWQLGLSLLVMLLTWIISVPVLKQRIPPVWLPIVSVGLGLLTQIFTLMVGGVVWWEALLSGLTTGAAASGLWSLLGKRVLPNTPLAPVVKVELPKVDVDGRYPDARTAAVATVDALEVELAKARGVVASLPPTFLATRG